MAGHPKLNAWSEGHNSAEDSMQGLGGADDDSVQDLAVKRGIVLLTNCTNCGRQWKGVIEWPEVAAYYIGPKHPLWQRLVNEKKILPTRQGIVSVMPCNGCNKRFRTVTDWDEVRRYVDIGIRTGCLDPKIKQARRAP